MNTRQGLPKHFREPAESVIINLKALHIQTDRKDNAMAVTVITKENFETEVLNAAVPVLVDFWAAWCGPCRMLSPLVDQAAEKRTDVKVGKVNVDEEPELAEEFGVSSIPTLILFKGGKAVKSSVGVIPMERLQELMNA